MAAPSGCSRREFIGRISTLCAAGFIPGSGRAGQAVVLAPSAVAGGPSFRFIVVNDLHHGSPECTRFLEKLAGQMRTHFPVAFCLVVGDLADTGEPGSLAAAREAFGLLGVPVYPVPGNHDCDLEQNTRIYREIFPERVNYTFAHRGWQFVAFDSTDGNAWHDTKIGDEAIGFLSGELARLDPALPTVVCTHFPLAPSVRFAPRNAGRVLQLFEAVNLRAAFCGHYHARTEVMWRSAALLTNACCSRMRDNHDGTLPEGYLVCTAHEDGTLEREFVEFAPARSV